jgi:Ni2+-binding GTPase involved in maturation of urease and hydrogenase
MRTQGILENLREKAAIFVTHKGVSAADEILRTRRVLIITGAPGVGKSTLADILLMTLVADDFQPVIVSKDIDDADQMYRISDKQVFYYDDFLGRTSITEKLKQTKTTGS